MSKQHQSLLRQRPWIAHIDDEREQGNSIIVTLANNCHFADDRHCGVRGYDTIAELKTSTSRANILHYSRPLTTYTVRVMMREQILTEFGASSAHLRFDLPTCEMQSKMSALSTPFLDRLQKTGVAFSDAIKLMRDAFNHQPPVLNQSGFGNALSLYR
jgi:hypothetical protein